MIHFALLLDKAWIGVKNVKFLPPLMLLSAFLAFKIIVPRVAKKDYKPSVAADYNQEKKLN